MKTLIIFIMFIFLCGCSLNGADPPDKMRWKYVKSSSGKCYEYSIWFNGYSGYIISGQVDIKYCDDRRV